MLRPPATNTADSTQLQGAAGVLEQGDSARLYRSMVYRHQVAQQAGADADGRVGPGLFTAYAILASGHQPADAEKLLREEIIWLATQPIPAAELDKVKTQLLTDELKQLGRAACRERGWQDVEIAGDGGYLKKKK